MHQFVILGGVRGVDDAWERDSSADFEDFDLALTSHRTLSGKGVGGVSQK
jgi:hypothetical protein